MFHLLPLQLRQRLVFGAIASGIAIALGGCQTQPVTLTLSSSIEGSSYQRISEQIARSARQVEIEVVDAYDSEGSRQNLQRLLDGEADLALSQLDIASEFLRADRVQSIAILAREHLHLLVRADGDIENFADLQGKRVAIGASGSGTRFTMERVLAASGITIVPKTPRALDSLVQLKDGRLDAIALVSAIGTSRNIGAAIASEPKLRLLPMPVGAINHLILQFPSSYQLGVIPKGTYDPLAPQPPEDLVSLSTGAAAIVRPEVKPETVGLLTWSILSTARQYAPFYPEIAESSEPERLLQRGLSYMAPAAQEVYQNGDPRAAWLRYLQENSDLQASLVMLLGTGGIGIVFSWWRRQRSATRIKASREAIADLQPLLESDAQQALENVEELRQRYRLMWIEGSIPAEVYEEVDRLSEVFADRCRAVCRLHLQKKIHDTTRLLDRLNESIDCGPERALEKLNQAEADYRKMLLDGAIDLSTYLQLQTYLQLRYIYLAPSSDLKSSTTSSH